MATRIAIYNDALGWLNERKLANLTENREPRYVLDDAWDGVVAHCFESGVWNWAMRSLEIPASASIVPTFGYANAFEQPSDMQRFWQMADNAEFLPQLQWYKDEGGVWYADVDPIWVRYVSNDTDYGMNLGRWTQMFADFVAARLAVRCCGRITGNDSRLDGLLKIEKKAKSLALSNDAMKEPPGRLPLGTWVRSRGGRMGSTPGTLRTVGIAGGGGDPGSGFDSGFG